MKNKKYILLIIVIIVVVIPLCIFMSSRINKHREENKQNTMAIIKELFDYENINFSDQEIIVEDFDKSTYIGIRHNNDGWSLFGSNVKDFYKPFTNEEVKSTDLIVFAISNYKYGNYKNNANKVTKLYSESAMLYYYNVKTGNFVIKEIIEGHELLESEKYSYDISNQNIIDKVKKDLGIK